MKNHSNAGKHLVAIPVLLLIAAVGIFVLRSFFAEPETTTHATVLPSAAPLSDFEMMDQDGEIFDKSSFRGRWSMVFFGFTNCPDICPVTLQKMASARRRMAEADPNAVLPDIVFVSVDPGRDTLATIAQYVQAFGDNVIGISGDPAELSKLARTFGVYFNVTPAEGEAYAVEHSAAVVVVNDRAEFQAVFSAPHDVDAFVHDMSLIIAAK
ncbi:MAG: SCO family protein [Gammaproteobacteria bacterium]|nr:SCO family protein [Gammaproteobacteria bacterium]